MQEHCKINSNAILIFANSSNEELKHKCMPKGGVLFQGLTEHAIKTAKKTGLPHFLITEKEQYGNSFGERFVNAIKSVFDKGYDNVITIGNDTPQLKPSDIIKASRLLQAKKAVLGPSRDGGFYLMGLHKSQFDVRAFRELPWKTNTLTKKITILIEASKVDVIQLRVLLDLDTSEDLQRVLNGLKDTSKKIFLLILSLVAPFREIIVQGFVPSVSNFNNTYFNKGSPFPLH